MNLRDAHWGRFAAYIVLVASLVFIFWNQHEDNQNDEATLCIRSHHAREDVRDAIETAIQGSTDAIINTVVGTGGKTENIKRYEEETQLVIDKARKELPDPECDFAAAVRELRH